MFIYIMQGLPGSGKSTIAAERARTFPGPDPEIVSADHLPGLYKTGLNKSGQPETTIDRSLLGKAHATCFRAALAALQEGRTVFVDNTNLTVEEVAPYVMLGQAFGASPVILRARCNVMTALRRNTHGVPSR